jgi:hypothetical protein
MGHHDLGVFLEIGGDWNGRQALLDVQEVAEHISAHEEFDFSRDQ